MIKKGLCNPRPHARRTLRVLSVLDEALCASSSKIIANIVTYPVETVRLSSLCQNPIRHPNRFIGIQNYIPYCIFNNIVTYKSLYTCIGFQCSIHADINLLLASICTAILTSFYKIPCGYMLKNRIIGEPINFKILYHPVLYSRAFVASLSEDVPEMFLKLFLNNLVTSCFPNINNYVSSMFAALITSIAITPMEFWKTSILCSSKAMSLSPMSIFIRIMINLTNMFIFFISFNFLRRFL